MKSINNQIANQKEKFATKIYLLFKILKIILRILIATNFNIKLMIIAKMTVMAYRIIALIKKKEEAVMKG
jgi:hypothetical protein